MCKSDQSIFCFSDDDQETFDDLGSKTDPQIWFATKLVHWLGYKDYTSFVNGPIDKAISICTRIQNVCFSENFHDFRSTLNGITIKDYKLSKFACYLIAMNSDSKKPEVAQAQAYFSAVLEIANKCFQDPKEIDRIHIRGELTDGEKALNQTVHKHGIENYAFFQNKGYLGLYNMNLNDLIKLKGIPNKRSLLDFIGREELAANLFRITQTESKIKRENITGQKKLENTHYSVGKSVRKTIEENKGIMPEDLPAERDIKKVRSDVKSTQKALK